MKLNLFNFDLCADFLKLSLEFLSLVLRNAFLDCLGSAVNKSLSLSKSKTCDVLNSLNNLDLLCACICKDNVELGLLLSCRACYCRTCNNCCCSGNAELLFYCVYEL